jgi:hypothetical protein
MLDPQSSSEIFGQPEPLSSHNSSEVVPEGPQNSDVEAPSERAG